MTAELTQAVALLADAMGFRPYQMPLPFPTDPHADEHFAALVEASKPRKDRRAREARAADPAPYRGRLARHPGGCKDTGGRMAAGEHHAVGPAKGGTSMLDNLIAGLVPGSDVTLLIGVALRLAGIVQIEDPAEAVDLLDGISDTQLRALPFVMAALVDIDKTPTELLAWAEYVPTKNLRAATAVAPPTVLLATDLTRASRTAECGTHNGWLGHLDRDEGPCHECGIAEAAWQRINKPESTRRQEGLPAA